MTDAAASASRPSADVESVIVLRRKVNALQLADEFRDWLDDACLLRYLRARDMDVELALAALRDTLQWRHTACPHKLRSSDPVIASQLATGKNYLYGRDRCGRPVVYMRMCRDIDASTPAEKLQFMLFNMELAHRRMDPVHVGVVWLVDLRGFSVGWMAPARMRLGLDLVRILQAHYPEFLHTLYLKDAPLAFRAFWKALRPFLHAHTQRKIVVLPSGAERSVLAAAIDPQQLEREFGGDSDYRYDADTYTAQLRAEEAVRWAETAGRATGVDPVG